MIGEPMTGEPMTGVRLKTLTAGVIAAASAIWLAAPAALPAQPAPPQAPSPPREVSPTDPTAWIRAETGWLHRASQMICPRTLGTDFVLTRIMDYGDGARHAFQTTPYCTYSDASNGETTISISTPMSGFGGFVEPMMSSDQAGRPTVTPTDRTSGLSGSAARIEGRYVSWSDSGVTLGNLRFEQPDKLLFLPPGVSRDGRRLNCLGCAEPHVHVRGATARLEAMRAAAEALMMGQTLLAARLDRCASQTRRSARLPVRAATPLGERPASAILTGAATSALRSTDAMCGIGEVHLAPVRFDNHRVFLEVTRLPDGVLRFTPPLLPPRHYGVLMAEIEMPDYLVLPERAVAPGGSWVMVRRRAGEVHALTRFAAEPSLDQAAHTVAVELQRAFPARE